MVSGVGIFMVDVAGAPSNQRKRAVCVVIANSPKPTIDPITAPTTKSPAKCTPKYSRE